MVSQPVFSGIGSEGLPFYSKDELLQSPSVKDGLETHREAYFRRQYTHFLTDVGRILGVPQWAIYTAVFLCHHYFAKRSMLRNDRYLVATACLYLACKVQESPKYLRDVIKEAERKKWERYAKEHPGEPKRWEDIPYMESIRDQVLVAERAVLYTVSFQLRIKTPYPEAIQIQKLLPDGPLKQDTFEIAWGILNDSLPTTLSLQYAPEKLAAAAMFIAHQMTGATLPQKDGREFCELTNIKAEELHDISDQLLEVYVVVANSKLAVQPIPLTQAGSPDGSCDIQLQGNRMHVVLQQSQQQQQQPLTHPSQQNDLTTLASPVQQPQQQQQQGLQQQQQQQPITASITGSTLINPITAHANGV